jgi:hypothetical protein
VDHSGRNIMEYEAHPSGARRWNVTALWVVEIVLLLLSAIYFFCGDLNGGLFGIELEGRLAERIFWTLLGSGAAISVLLFRVDRPCRYLALLHIVFYALMALPSVLP